ncbi:hypothetical protein HG536_0A08160 [Torulaspora globosa]|uniref:Letm1 RBD domain-containing protein n=1 Tax=Torulaspora globosa TaxID=48254 RepID=A0A7G3ZBW5_9SACH|nr:uncharacterized protein HG536_0A08160 [Torulaspora globosa]QLL31001.1 hypothetical protein HG536_0A08160 [Torulaspora globosa]
MGSWFIQGCVLRSKVASRPLQYSTQAHQQLPLSLSSINVAGQGMKANKLLKKLGLKLKAGELQLVKLAENCDGGINSDRSLPMTEFPKQKIFIEVASDNGIAAWRKGIVKWFRLGVHMMKYYKYGLQNTYRVAKDTKYLIADKDLDSKTPLATQMAKLIEFNEIRARLNKAPNSLPLTRKQFVEYYRRGQVWKIPTFFLIALVLEELTAVICYFFPKVAPHNCLTPGGYLKISRSHANITDLKDPAKYKSPYNLAKKQLFQILRTSPIIQTPSWRLRVYALIDNKRQPCETLVQIHQYLFVDDWLLLKSILTGKEARLSYRELVNCIWERQLYSKDEDLNKMVNDDTGRRILIWRLFLYWSFRFDKTVTVGGDQLFSEKWGVNNVSILNHTGLDGRQLLGVKGLSALEENV